MPEVLDPRDSFKIEGRRLRWFQVTGRSRGGVLEVGWFLAASRRAALRRALREKARLVQGLKLEAH